MSDDGPGTGITQPVRITKRHRLDAFDCGAPELNTWLAKFGWSNDASGNARVFVAARGDEVVGYYSLSTAGVAKAQAHPDLLKGGTPSEIPCLLIGRMAVNQQDQGAHLGRSLLIDALRRVVRLLDDVGFRALVIHARDEEAKAWYQHQARSFRQSPSDPRHLFLPIKELRRLAADS